MEEDFNLDDLYNSKDNLSRFVSHPECFNPSEFDWEYHSSYICKYYPEYFDPDKFNWRASHLLFRYNSGIMDLDRYCYDTSSEELLIYQPGYFDPERFDWENKSEIVDLYAPKLKSYQT